MNKTVNVLYISVVDDCSESDEEKSDEEEMSPGETNSLVVDQVDPVSGHEPDAGTVVPVMAPVVAPIYNVKLASNENGELYWICTRVGLARLANRRSQGRLNRLGAT